MNLRALANLVLIIAYFSADRSFQMEARSPVSYAA